MGSLPAIFSGNQAEAEHFINGVQAYIQLNREVPGFTSPMKKIALVLTLMQGDKVADWVNDMGQALDELDPATDNIPALWTMFFGRISRTIPGHPGHGLSTNRIGKSHYEDALHR